MATEKISGEIRPASYLSPIDRQQALRITKALKNSKTVEEVIYYQKQLEALKAKANRNKNRIDRGIRRQALDLQKLDRAEKKARYSNFKREQENHLFELEEMPTVVLKSNDMSEGTTMAKLKGKTGK